MKKTAFTLGEILVSMTIIGILAAVLVPILFDARPRDNVVMFKKAYAITSKIISGMTNDELTYPNEEILFAISNATSPEDAASTFCKKFLSYLNTLESDESACSNSTGDSLAPFARTTDGMRWYFAAKTDERLTNDQQYYYKIIVDVNDRRGPNCELIQAEGLNTSLCAAGHSCTNVPDNCKAPDTFIIGVNRLGQLAVGNVSWLPESNLNSPNTYDANTMNNPMGLK